MRLLLQGIVGSRVRFAVQVEELSAGLQALHVELQPQRRGDQVPKQAAGNASVLLGFSSSSGWLRTGTRRVPL